MDRRYNSWLRDIGCYPLDVLGGAAEALLRQLQSSLGNIEDSDIPVPTFEQIIHEGRLTGSDIDDRRRTIRRGTLNQIQGDVKMGAEPAKCLWRCGAEKPFPVGMNIHTHLHIVALLLLLERAAVQNGSIHPKRATLRRRSAAASSVSCLFAKQKRTRCAPKAGCEKKLDPGTAATPISSTRCLQNVTSSGKPKLEMSHIM